MQWHNTVGKKKKRKKGGRAVARVCVCVRGENYKTDGRGCLDGSITLVPVSDA